MSQIISVATAAPCRPGPPLAIWDPSSAPASFAVRPGHPRPFPKAPAGSRRMTSEKLSPGTLSLFSLLYASVLIVKVTNAIR